MATMTKTQTMPTSSPKAIPLWQQLQSVVGVLQAVHNGQSTQQALADVPAALRPGVQALSYAALRQWGVARALRQLLVPRKPQPAIDALLCGALALLWQQAPASESNQSNVYTDFTLVNQAVEAAKRHPKWRHQSNLVNAVLRRYLREQAQWHADMVATSPQQEPALRNVPAWWWQRLQRDYGEQALEVVRASLQPALMTLRVNAQHMTAEAYLQQHLLPAGLQAVCNGEYGVTLTRAVPVQQLPGFAQGWVSVQDQAAQQAAPLLLAQLLEQGERPLRVLDACAAPGGKTAHLLELNPHLQVIALEVDAARAERIHDNLQRIGAQAQVLVADAGDVAAWWDGEPFDAILLDAPCTASGIMRRHPDVPWLRRAEDVPQLAAQQRRLLEAMWPLLREGGAMVYCTCSVFKEEGEQQVVAFLQRHRDAIAHKSPGHLLPTVLKTVQNAQYSDHDGFFYALFTKQTNMAA